MFGFLIRRALQSVVALAGVVVLMFVVLRVVPGDPAELMLGIDASDAEHEAMRVKLGLDRSIAEQFASYVAGVTHLDFGNSFRLPGSAFDNVLHRLPATATLAIAAMVLAITISIPMGIIASRRPGGALDRLIAVTSISGQALPNFWVGIMLILVFSRGLGVLPVGGSGTPAHLVMPALTLALPLIGVLTRLTRLGFIQEMHELYTVTARAKGLSERQILFGHAARNTLIPVVTVAGLQMGSLLGGAIIVETVFSWPGIGRLLVDAVFNRDYPVVQATVAVIAGVFLLTNFLVDLTYGFLDPRIRLGRSS